jgi:hypothetical protein
MTAEQNTLVSEPISERRLWFGFSTSAIAWSIAFLVDVMLSWQACMGGEAGSSIFTRTWMEIVLGCVTFGLLGISILAGIISYRNWEKLTHESDVFHGEGRARRQFMGIAGVIITITLGAGMVWASVPIYVLSICMRWR